MKRIFFSMGIALLTVIGVHAQSINTSKSKVTFEISNMKWKTVEGSFSGMKGEVNFQESDLKNSYFKVCVDAKTVNTENEKRDEHLRTEDFFNVSAHPTICFESTSVVKTDKGYKVIGNLTMHGVTLQEEILFIYANNTFTGQLNVERYAYKIGEDTGEFMVGNEVNLTIVCVVE